MESKSITSDAPDVQIAPPGQQKSAPGAQSTSQKPTTSEVRRYCRVYQSEGYVVAPSASQMGPEYIVTLFNGMPGTILTTHALKSMCCQGVIRRTDSRVYNGDRLTLLEWLALSPSNLLGDVQEEDIRAWEDCVSPRDYRR